YGGTFSYWNTKSNSKSTWGKIAEVNAEAKYLAETLFLDQAASEISPPALQGGFLYSKWRKGKDFFLIVVNSRNEDAKLELLVGSDVSRYTSIKSLFQDQQLFMSQPNKISDTYQPFESKVYLLSP